MLINRRNRQSESGANLVQQVFHNSGYNTRLAQVIDKMGQEQRPVQRGRGYQFDGVDDTVIIPDNAATRSITNQATFIATFSSTVNNIVVKSGTPANNWGSYILGWVNATQIRLYFDNLATNRWVSFVVTMPPAVNGFWEIVAVWNNVNGNATDTRIWVNGIEQSVSINTSNNYTNTFVPGYQALPVTIGSFNSTSFANNVIYNVGLWNRAWTVAEVNDYLLYNKIPLNNSIGFYKCDEGGGTLAIDSSGNALDGTIINANLATFHTTFTNGQGADWQNLVGFTPAIRVQEDQNITIVDNTNLGIGQNFTIDFPVVLTGGTGDRGFCEKYNGVDNNYFQIYTNAAGRVVVSFVVGGVTQCSLTSSTALATDTRYHIEYVRTNGSEHRLFIAGTLEASNLTGGSLNYNLNRDWHFGRLVSNAPNYDMNGWLWLPRIAFTSRHTANFTPPTTFADYDLNEIGLVLLMQDNSIALVNKFGNTITNTNTATQYVPRNEISPLLDAFGEPLFYRNRVKYNSDLVQANCLTFDGVNDFVDATITNTSAANFTISFWANFTRANTYEIPLSIGNQTLNNQWDIVKRDALNQILDISVFGGYNYRTQSPVLLNQLALYTIVLQGTAMRVYYNGIQVGGSFTSGTGASTNFTALTRIGGSTAGVGANAQMRLIDYRRYHRALSDAEIQGLYNGIEPATTNLIEHYPCSEGGGDRLFNKVGTSTATLTNFNLTNAWANRQDRVHGNLLNGGFETYTDGGTGVIRVPRRANGTWITPTIAGYTKQSENPSGTWHDDAESMIRQPLAPQLIRNDVSNYMFNGGVANNLTAASFPTNSGGRIKTDNSQYVSARRKANLRVKRVN